MEALVLTKPRLLKREGVWRAVWQEGDLPVSCDFRSASRDSALKVANEIGAIRLRQQKAFAAME